MTPEQKKAVEKTLNHIETAQEELHKAQRTLTFAGEPYAKFRKRLDASHDELEQIGQNIEMEMEG
jgi:hypothetical protein